ncbi:MAG: hypothetical protein JJU28_09610 [Cyclobacteriaceae bacterium]|nr:hypothetical protein [Cyclobacteriaceae bacterium]
MKIIKLSDNHKRSLSGTLFHLEKLLVEMERSLKCHVNQSMIRINHDLPAESAELLEHTLAEMKYNIAHMVEKYGLRPKTIEQSKIFYANHVKIWEILSDARSKKMENYGAFPEEHKEEFDNDIGNLLNLANTLGKY